MSDREAQRAIRERTKNQIETLERRIQELTNQQPYQELQAAVRAREAVERENADIRRQLAGVVGLLQSVIAPASPSTAAHTPSGPSTVASAASASTQSSYASLGLHHNVSPAAAEASSPSGMEPPSAQAWRGGGGGGAGEQGRTTTTTTTTTTQQQQLRPLDMGPERLGLDFVLEPGQRVPKILSGPDGAQDSPQYHHIPMKHDWTATSYDQAQRKGLGSSDSWIASPTSVDASSAAPSHTPRDHQHHHDHHQQQQQQQQAYQQVDEVARCLIPTKNCGPTCPLDALLLDFLSERRQRAADGVAIQEVVGPRYPSVSSLLNPSASAYSHPLSKFFTDILATFPDISALPERVAVLYVMFLVMRWQISPSPDSFRRLPAWVRPLPCQLRVAHPAWVDYVPFPRMRDRVCRHDNPADYLFDNFFVPFTTTLTLSWPYEDTDVLLRSPDTDELLINPVFERHLRRIENWKLGDAFAKAFPSLADTYTA